MGSQRQQRTPDKMMSCCCSVITMLALLGLLLILVRTTEGQQTPLRARREATSLLRRVGPFTNVLSTARDSYLDHHYSHHLHHPHHYHDAVLHVQIPLRSLHVW